MRVLIINKFLYPKGGAETYVFKLGDILQKNGHEVQYFGMEDENNVVGNSSGAYVRPQNFQNGIKSNLTAPFRIIYSLEARKKIRIVLDNFQPDVVHLNNIQFHLTPSIILEINKYREQTGRKVKIIYTAHDYQLICPSHGLFDSDIKPCEKCIGGNYLHCLKTKCVKGSRVKSLLGMLDAYFWTVSKAYSYIDTIICPSKFMKTKLDMQERFKEKTVVLHNFVDAVKRDPVVKEKYILEFGHLSKDKGTETVVAAGKKLPTVKFVFAGYGASVDKIQCLPNAEYVGFKSGEELISLIEKATASVCPSECYENCPFSVIESQMYLTPVIGARIGGIPELIQEGITGELFEPGNVEELSEKILKLWDSPELATQYSENCRNLDIETPQTYYQKIMKIYSGGTK